MRVQNTSDSQVLLASAARTATFNSNSVTKRGYKGAIFSLFCSARSGTSPTLDVKIQGYDHASGNWYDIHGAAFAQLTNVTSAPVYLAVYPGIAETANQTVSDVMPPMFRAVCTIGGTTPSFTFTLGYTMVA